MRPRDGERRQAVRPRFLVAALVIAGAAGLALWLGFESGDEPAPRRAPVASEARRPPPIVVPAPVAPRREPQPTVQTSTRGDVHDELPHSHPITPERARIQRENQLIGALNDAVDLGDVLELRKLVAKYRDEYPEDEHALQEGYERIADCLEHPGPESRAAAQRYYDEQRASTLRRYVRRACFEPQG